MLFVLEKGQECERDKGEDNDADYDQQEEKTKKKKMTKKRSYCCLLLQGHLMTTTGHLPAVPLHRLTDTPV